MADNRKMTSNEKLIKKARGFRVAKSKNYIEIALADALERELARQEDSLTNVDIEAITRHYVYLEVVKVVADDRLDEWLEYQRPKSMEEWDEYYAAHPDMKDGFK